MTDFLQQIAVPDGWTVDDATGLAGCVVLLHKTYGFTTIDTKRRIYAPGSATPNQHKVSMTYKGKGWEQRIVNDATSHNASFWVEP